MSMMNRLANAGNEYQGTYKKVLCVCSAGLLRSPTTAFVLSQSPYNFNTRACGLTAEYALIPLDDVLLKWADEIVCMDANQQIQLKKMTDKPGHNLSIPDRFKYRDPELMDLIKERYKEYEGK
jgi:predicted protein tyrosine phosphatase